MDNIVYERDCRFSPEETPESGWTEAVWERAIEGGVLRRYADEMSKLPKIIVPEDKANYEYLLERCDGLAKRLHGQICGTVDYNRWDSHIELLLPFAEFSGDNDRILLKEIAEKAHMVTFTAEDDGCVRLSIMINYFDELVSDEQKGYIRYDAIMSDTVLADMLHMPELSPEQKELTERMKVTLDRFDAETEVDRTTAFRSVLEHMMEMDEESQTLEYMADRLERFLETLLTGGEAK